MATADVRPAALKGYEIGPASKLQVGDVSLSLSLSVSPKSRTIGLEEKAKKMNRIGTFRYSSFSGPTLQSLSGSGNVWGTRGLSSCDIAIRSLIIALACK